MSTYKGNPNLNPTNIININFPNAFQDTIQGYQYLKNYLSSNNIPEIYTFDIPKAMTVELVRSISKPGVNGFEAASHIDLIKPDFVLIEEVFSPVFAENTSGYFVLRQYLHELLTGEYDEVYDKPKIINDIQKTKKAISDFVITYSEHFSSGQKHGYITYLFKSTFIFKVKIGLVDLVEYCDYSTNQFIENKADAEQYGIQQRLIDNEEAIIDLFLQHDEIMLATNKDLRDELAKKIYMQSKLQAKMPIKPNDWYSALGYMLQKAQSIYEIDILPDKIDSMLKEGLTQKEIVDNTGLSTNKVRNIIKVLKMKDI